VKTSSVEKVAAADYVAYQEGNSLKVVAEEGTNVTIYAADGKVLGNYVMNANTMTINNNLMEGVLLVRMNKGNNSNFAKVLWK
jgi:fructose-1,6-bisphosphatase